jgi:hypothetical protein
VDVAKGTFLSHTSNGSTRSVTGLSFQPKLVFLWTVMRSAVGITRSASVINFGAATSSSDQGWCAYSSDDTPTTMNTGRYQRTDSCIGHIDSGTPTLQGYATFTSMNSDGFTVTWTDALTVAWDIHYLAIGGSDLTAAKVGNFSVTSAGSTPATQDVTGVGFQPTAYMLFGIGLGATSSLTANANFHIGAADGSRQWAQATADEDNVPTSLGASTFSGSEVLRIIEPTTQAIDAQAAHSSFLSDGFQINITNRPAADTTVFYVATQSTGVYVGHDTAPVTNTTKNSSAQDPDGVLFATVCQSADDTTTTTVAGSGNGVSSVEIGAMTSAAQGMAGTYSDDAAGTAVCSKRHATADVMFMGNPGNPAATMGTAAYSALGTTDFTLSWSSTNGTAHRFGYMSFGVPPAAPSYTSRLALMGVG